MERARFVEHKGKKIFVLDFSGCLPTEIFPLIDECARMVRTEPGKSVLTLTIANGGRFDLDTISKLKNLTKGNEPFVKKSAIVGITGLQEIVLMTVSRFSNREFHIYDNVEKAMDFLVAD